MLIYISPNLNYTYINFVCGASAIYCKIYIRSSIESLIYLPLITTNNFIAQCHLP
jgi:hypothetical protein